MSFTSLNGTRRDAKLLGNRCQGVGGCERMKDNPMACTGINTAHEAGPVEGKGTEKPIIQYRVIAHKCSEEN